MHYETAKLGCFGQAEFGLDLVHIYLCPVALISPIGLNGGTPRSQRDASAADNAPLELIRNCCCERRITLLDGTAPLFNP
jgi:hypothetical protein